MRYLYTTMKGVWQYLVYGSWWVAACAAAMGLLTLYELTENWWNAPLAVFILGSTLVIYNLNMISGTDELRKLGTDSVRHHWCMENEAKMKATLVIGLVLAGVSIWFLSRTIWLLLIPLSMMAFAYAAPIIRRNAAKIRIREIGLWKIFIIAVVWTGMTAVLPTMHVRGLEAITDLCLWPVYVERGLFILAITIPFDVRDLVNDAKKGVRTIPSTLGWKRSVWLAEVILAVFLALVTWRLGIDRPLVVGYVSSTLITMAVVVFANPHRNDMYCSFWVEGTMMLQFASVILLA